jgi:uncharacterized membrane protein|tara:strand:- start:893 stop:1084 length:192 start_codon:yes stop_codon:yes gene_type:complete
MHKLKSRKFWAAILFLVLVPLEKALGIDMDIEAFAAQVAPTIAYILGESYIDSKSIKDKPPEV